MAVIDSLSLRDFRSFNEYELALAPGLTVITGENGRGKSNLVESIGFLSELRSFRHAPHDALVRVGHETAFIRAIGHDNDRELQIEIELPRVRRARVLVNRQRLVKTSELASMLPSVVFSPDDLAIVKGAPSQRRHFLDQLVGVVEPRGASLIADYERALKQRNALLKQCGHGRLDESGVLTLDVWDQRLGDLGDVLGQRRVEVCARLNPIVSKYYHRISPDSAALDVNYSASWLEEGLASVLQRHRDDDLRRSVTSFGPHRDDVALSINGMNARVCASQGEQRSLVLSLRLASHELITEALGVTPMLLLDDVFSELDPHRSGHLVECLPRCQTLMTSAGDIPSSLEAESVYALESS